MLKIDGHDDAKNCSMQLLAPHLSGDKAEPVYQFWYTTQKLFAQR
jgi:hypothetical protein